MSAYIEEYKDALQRATALGNEKLRTSIEKGLRMKEQSTSPGDIMQIDAQMDAFRDTLAARKAHELEEIMAIM